MPVTVDVYAKIIHEGLSSKFPLQENLQILRGDLTNSLMKFQHFLHSYVLYYCIGFPFHFEEMLSSHMGIWYKEMSISLIWQSSNLEELKFDHHICGVPGTHLPSWDVDSIQGLVQMPRPKRCSQMVGVQPLLFTMQALGPGCLEAASGSEASRVVVCHWMSCKSTTFSWSI